MKRNTIAVFIVLMATLALAQGARVLKGHGIKKLSVFIGKWRSETLVNGKSQGTAAISACRWSGNGNYMIADQMVTNGNAKTNNLSIYSYEAATDSYKLSIVGAPGMAPFSINMVCKGDELIYLGNYTDDKGKKIYTRTLNDFVSPGYYTFKVQSSPDSSTWATSLEGRSVKISN